MPGWPLWSLPVVLLIGIGLWLLSSAVVAVAASAGGAGLNHPPAGVSIALGITFELSFAGAAVAFTRSRFRARPGDFGYRRVPLGLAVGSFITAGVGYYVLTLLYALVLNLHGKDKLPDELKAGHGTVAMIAAALFVCVAAPIAEELFFRGFVFGVLRQLRVVVAGRDVGTWVAAALTGVLFGAAHFSSASVQYLVPLGILGFVLCLLRWRTGSLYPGMALHSVNNALALAINESGWTLAGTLAAMVGSLAVIAAVSGPLAEPSLPDV